MQGLGFSKSIADPNLYIKVVQNLPLILVFYVDDLFLTGEELLIAECKRELASEFEMKDLGLLHYFLGLEVQQKTNEIFLSQGKYVRDILSKFGMTGCKPMVTPMVTNLKKLHGAVTRFDPVDPIHFKKLIGLFGAYQIRYLLCRVLWVNLCLRRSISSRLLRNIYCGTQDLGLKYTSGGGVLLLGLSGSL